MAYISYFHSLKQFCVQMKNNIQIIEEISQSLQSHLENEPSLIDIKSGDLVAAKHESDGLWYRAKILKIEEYCVVQFIDYGNSVSVVSSNLRKLPGILASYHALAYHCMLDNVDDDEHIILTNNFIYNAVFDFITTIELNLTFLSDKEPYVVKMKWSNRNIKTFIKNIISYGITPKIYESLKIYESGTKMQVNVVYIQSINEFYVETLDSEEIKGKIEYELVNGKIWEPVTEYKFGKMAIAKSLSDKRWYRVRILEVHDEDKCTCYLVDYGVQDKCTEFYEAVGYLKSTPPFIKRCSLNMPNIEKKKMFNSLSNSFIEEIVKCKDQNMIINITIVKTGEPYVVDLYVDNMNMAEIIQPKPVVVFRVFHLNVLTVQIHNKERCAILNILNKNKNLRKVKKPKVGQLYGAYLIDQWYRVLLNIKYGNQFMEVTMVDMGCKKLQVQELFDLPRCMKNLKYMTIHCSLGLDEKNFNVNRLRQICNDGKTEFMMMILKENEVGGHHIQLFLDDKDVAEIIKYD